MESDSSTRIVLGVPLNDISLSDALLHVEVQLRARRKLLISVLDVAMIMNMRLNSTSDTAIRDSELIFADGYYVVLASKIVGSPLSEQVTGYDMAVSLMERAAQHGFRIFFFGAEEAVINRLARHVENAYGENIIAGIRNGYFAAEDEAEIVEQINASGADMLFVGISSPIRELFLSRHKHSLNVPILMGVGGVFDILGGKTTRAPQWVRSVKLEWFYRFILEPRRMWRRVFVLYPSFTWLVFKDYLKTRGVKAP